MTVTISDESAQILIGLCRGVSLGTNQVAFLDAVAAAQFELETGFGAPAPVKLPFGLAHLVPKVKALLPGKKPA